MGPTGNGFDLTDLRPRSESLDYWRWDRCSSFGPRAKQLHEQGVEVHSVLGLCDQRSRHFENEAVSQVAHVTITTDDGTYGTKGYVSTVIDQDGPGV